MSTIRDESGSKDQGLAGVPEGPADAPTIAGAVSASQTTGRFSFADPEAPTPDEARQWRSTRNERRIALIIKREQARGLSAAEQAELDRLEAEAARIHSALFRAPAPATDPQDDCHVAPGVLAGTSKARRELSMVSPFEYPSHPHQRRHGPRGYADYTRYKPTSVLCDPPPTPAPRGWANASSSFGGATSFQTLISFWSLNPRPLAVRPEALQAIRRAFEHSRQPPWESLALSRGGTSVRDANRSANHGGCPSDANAPSGGYLTETTPSGGPS
jgi:hypothetical protein